MLHVFIRHRGILLPIGKKKLAKAQDVPCRVNLRQERVVWATVGTSIRVLLNEFLLRSYNAKALRASVPTLSLAVLLGTAALPARAQTLSSYDVDALPESKPTSSPPQIQCNSGELRSRRQRAISRRGGHAWQLLDQGLRDLAKHRASDESLTQHGTAKAAACGDKVEILDVVNGGHFDISAPGTKAWDQVEIFILDHAFDQTATHTP